MRTAELIAYDLANAPSLTDGLSSFSGFTDNTRKIIRIAALVAAREARAELIATLPPVTELTAATEDAAASRSADGMDAVFDARDTLDDLVGRVITALNGAPA